MAERRVYLDTSAYLAILLGAKEAPELQRTLKGAVLCSSALLLIEAERNLVRLVRQSQLDESDYESARKQLGDDQALFLLRHLTPDLCLTGEYPPVRIPRSSDLAHLRTARWFQANGGLHLFMTLDRDQLASAKSFGLPT